MMNAERENMQNYDKGQLRKLALSKRDSLEESYRRIADEKIKERLLKLQAVQDAKTVMCYKSFRSEADTSGIIKALEEQGKELCFPVCGKSGIMQAWHPLNEAAWKTGKMGICEPDVENSTLIEPQQIDLVICPMVAFDAQCRRMGYGGGYYDRYLPQCTNARRVAIAFEAQRVEALITEQYDQPMDNVITEEKIY